MKNVFFCVLLVLASCAFSLGQTHKVLWSFGGAPNDGANPISDLVFDKAGNMYGTTQFGGTSTNGVCGFGVVQGCGTVFELSPNSNGSWTETVIYSFCDNPVGSACPDGEQPMAGLAMDNLGNLYGTTYFGGLQNCGTEGCGTMFELSPPQQPGGSWTSTTLYTFCSVYGNFVCLDGAEPASHLTFDASGNLYGTTSQGGTGQWYGGTVFELSPPQSGGSWTETVLYNFCVNGSTERCPDGTRPLAGVTFDNLGNLYGTAEWGGAPRMGGGGTVYELSPGANGWTYSVLLAFYNGVADVMQNPQGVVGFDAEGNIYSTANLGGPRNAGGIFRLNRQKQIVRAITFDGNDGGNPTAGVIVDQKTGTILGTSTTGVGGAPGGTAFEIGKEGVLTVLYSFCQQANCADGAEPSATLSSHSGNLYGTTKSGGISSESGGNGVVFEITP